MNELLVHKLLTGECSPAEREAVEKWLSESETHASCFEKMKSIWTLAADLDTGFDADTEAEWYKFSLRMEVLPAPAKIVPLPSSQMKTVRVLQL